ncbi:MAG TPA: hypothetical protein VET83_02145 [Candidatus Dormibacteraeota bacterium]|nr:hypothetical protein [Candidatus Dormibacteraeota bacterium]
MRRIRIAFLSLLFSCGTLLPLLVQTSAAEDLTGKTLKPAIGVKFGMESALGSLLGGTLTGDVTQVVVRRDEPTKLVLAVTYKGFQGAKLWCEVTGSDRKTLRQVKRSPTVTLEDATSEVECTVELDSNVPENTNIRSEYLRVCVAKPEKTTPSYVKAYELSKPWRTGIRPENVLLTVTLKPVGTTQSLGATPSAPIPPRLILMPAAGGTLRGSSPQLIMKRSVLPAPAPTTGGTASSSQAMIAQPPPGQAATASPSGSAVNNRIPIRNATFMTPNTAVILRTDMVVKMLPPSTTVTPINQNQFGVPAEDQNRGAKGPSAIPVEPLAELRSEDIDLDASHVLGVYPSFYPDQQDSLGIFYFLPYSYSLRWTEDQGYDMRMIYSATRSEGQAGDVAIAARLDAGLGIRERQIASELMAAYAKSRGSRFTALRALPVDSISVSISDDLRRYSIPADKIAVTGLSDILGQIDVSWLADPVTKENLQQALVEDVGISGRVTLFPSGGKLAPIDVPLRIRLADFVTFGPFRWNRADPWRNQTLYPIRLKYLNALVLDASSRPIVYSWDLSSTVVPPQGRAQWVAGSVPGWIDSQAKRVWLEYAVDATCAACDETVIRSITGGVSTSGPSQITFHTITPLADTGGYEIAAQVRSRYFDPQSHDSQTRTVVLSSDSKDFTIGPLYLGSRQAGESVSGDPLFEYFLTLTMKDGTTYRATRWVSSDDLRLAIGKHQLEEAFGSLPGPGGSR